MSTSTRLSRHKAFLRRQSFFWDSSLAWPKFSQNCAFPVQFCFLPSVLFQPSDLYHALQVYHTYSCLGFSLSFICVFPNKSLEHLILSCCLLLGGCGLIQQEFCNLFMVPLNNSINKSNLFYLSLIFFRALKRYVLSIMKTSM